MSIKNKVVLTGIEARNALMKGAKFVADAVRPTLGPYAHSFAIEKNNEVIDDGVTIAREIVSGGIHNEAEARGARMLVEASVKTEDMAGDGTTTAMTLANAIVQEILKYLPKDNIGIGKKKPAEIITEIDKECGEVVEMLKKKAVPIETKEEIINSAIVSAGDKELGTLIGTAQFEIGKDGWLIAEDTHERMSSVERVPGVRIDNGFVTSNVINNQEKQSLELTDIPVLLTNYTFTDFNGISGLLQEFAHKGQKSLVIVGRAFNETAIRICQENFRNGFNLYPLNAPYQDQNEIMKDLAAVLGGRYINNEETDLPNVTLADIGFATKIQAKRFETIFAGRDDVESRKRVASRIADLKLKDASASVFESKNISMRISQLTNGFSIVKVGAKSDLRQKFLKRKADDAVAAVRAAYKEGVVAGGGLAFKEISETLPDTYILKRPLMAIYDQIMFSAPEGFTVKDDVKDPVFVLRTALENACSVASQFAMACGTINTEKDKPLDLLLRKTINTDSE